MVKNKINKILEELKVIKNVDDNNEIVNLLKTPKKEPPKQMPHHRASSKNYTHNIDLLFLPEDQGFNYLLVVVDIGTKLTDAEPLKSKSSAEVRDALKKIYKRKILSLPKVIQHDAGGEFEKDFHKHFSKITSIFKTVAGRHRQNAVVEAKNKQFGAILNTKMLAEEMANEDTNKEWVDIIPQLVQKINKYFEQKPYKTDIDKPIITNSVSENMLPIGTVVRYKLDNPVDYVAGSKLHGTFRTSDLRWSKTKHTITNVILNPDTPPLYQLDDNGKVAYTIYQLQVVKPDEIKPTSEKFYAQEVLSEKKIKGKIFYEILWEDKSKTFEPRTEMIKQIPDMVKEYQQKIKKGKK
jgi:hypothetical protein